jgi:hypothetical protein
VINALTTGHLSTEDEECSGRPTQVTIPEKVDAIHSMILDDRRISAKRQQGIRIVAKYPVSSTLFFPTSAWEKKVIGELGSQD